MSIEDVVKRAMLITGRLTPEQAEEVQSQVDNEDTALVNQQSSVAPEEEESVVNYCVSRCILELIQKNQLEFKYMSIIRRVFQRVLFHLLKQRQACSLSAVKRQIDPRYRHYVPIVLQKCVQENLITTFDDTSGKMMYAIAHNQQQSVINYLSKEKAVDVIEYQKSKGIIK